VDSLSKELLAFQRLLVVLTLSVPVLQLGSHPELYLYCICSSVYSLAHTLAVFCTASAVPKRFVGYISNTFYCILYYVRSYLTAWLTPCAVFCTASNAPSATPFAVSNPPTTASVAPSATLLRLLLHLFRFEKTSPIVFAASPRPLLKLEPTFYQPPASEPKVAPILLTALYRLILASVCCSNWLTRSSKAFTSVRVFVLLNQCKVDHPCKVEHQWRLSGHPVSVFRSRYFCTDVRTY